MVSRAFGVKSETMHYGSREFIVNEWSLSINYILGIGSNKAGDKIAAIKIQICCGYIEEEL